MVLSLSSWSVLLGPNVNGEIVMYDLWIERAGICMMKTPHAISYGSSHRRLVSGVRGFRVYQCCLAVMHSMAC